MVHVKKNLGKKLHFIGFVVLDIATHKVKNWVTTLQSSVYLGMQCRVLVQNYFSIVNASK